MAIANDHIISWRIYMARWFYCGILKWNVKHSSFQFTFLSLSISFSQYACLTVLHTFWPNFFSSFFFRRVFFELLLLDFFFCNYFDGDQLFCMCQREIYRENCSTLRKKRPLIENQLVKVLNIFSFYLFRREDMEKVNIKFYDNFTVSYQHKKILQFVPELSIDRNMKITTPNIPLLVSLKNIFAHTVHLSVYKWFFSLIK